MSAGNNGEPSNRLACASCRHQRKKCTNCALAPYFPATRMEDFQAVHKVFGVSNIAKMIKSLENEPEREEAVKSFLWEAYMWKEHPVHGPLGQYRKLEEMLKLLKEELEEKRTQQMLQSAIEPSVIGLNQWNSNNGTRARVPDYEVEDNTINYTVSNGELVLESTVNNIPRLVQGEERQSQAMDSLIAPYHDTIAQRQEGDRHGGEGLVVPYHTHAVNYSLLRGHDQRGTQGRDDIVTQNEGMMSSGRSYLERETIIHVGDSNAASYGPLLPPIQEIVRQGRGGGYVSNATVVHPLLVQSQGRDPDALGQLHWRNSLQSYNIPGQFNQVNMGPLGDSTWEETDFKS